MTSAARARPLSRSSATASRIPIVYLVSSAVSSRLLSGQLSYLVSQGYDVTVGVNLTAEKLAHPFDEGVALVDLPFTRKLSPLRDLVALWSTLRMVRRVRPLIVNASTPKAGLLGMLAARIARVPVRVYVVRGLRYETTTGVQRQLLARLERLAMDCATEVVFNSASVRAVAERAGLIATGRGLVLGAGSGNGVNVDRFADLPTQSEARAALGVPADAEVVGFVGRLTRAKGIHDLFAMFCRLAEGRPALRLVMVGHPEPADRGDEDLLASLAAHERVHLLEATEHVGVAYRAFDVLAFASYREGLPNVLLEAQFCRTPVVAYGAAGTVDAVADGVSGVLVPTGDVCALVTEMARLLDDAELRARLGGHGAAWVSATFRREEVWAALNDLYRVALERSTLRPRFATRHS